MRALITGGHGFVGRHLASHLVSCGDDVAVTYLAEVAEEENKNSISLPKTSQTLALDVTDKKAVDDLINLIRPDAVYHLAACAFVPDGEDNPQKVFNVNTFGTTNLLSAISKYSRDTRFLYVASGEVYGEPRPGTLPFVESTPLRPLTIYGVTKAAADLATFKYAQTDGVHAVRVRPFPHVGPGQSDRFAIASFAKQVAMIKLGEAEPIIKVGNLETKRDYSDVSDIVRGYREALLNGSSGEAYNLCSGKSYEIGELLNKLIEIAEVDVEIVEDPARLRKIDIAEAYGSFEKAQKDFGWKPRIDLDGTLHSIFAHWIEVLSK